MLIHKIKEKMHIFLSFLLLINFLISSCAPREAGYRPTRPAKIALALGAGASKGFAHIGVLKVLETHKIPIHMIVGTSVGSFVGSLYAYGLNSFQLQKMAMSIEKGDIVDLTIPDNGFIKGERLENYINSVLKNTPIEQLRLPFYAVATNVQTGQEIIFGKGNTGKAVRASCSIPGIFRPVSIGDQIYVDGGLVSPVPVEAAKKMGADIVIAVDISGDIDNSKPENTIETILKSINIMYSNISKAQIQRADVVIRPRVGHISSSDFTKRHEAILEGERAVLEMLPTIQNLLTGLKQDGRME